MRVSLPIRFASIAAVAALTAGCAGGGTSPAPLSAAGSAQAQSLAHATGPVVNPDSTKVMISPKKVILTASNPIATVTVTGPNGTATISESDDCASPDVATIAGSGSAWTVTAGTSAGVCHALFTARNANGKKLGNGNLKIENKI